VSYLQNIASLTTDNGGGLIDLRIIRKADVLAIPEPVNGVVYGPITFKPGVTGFVVWKATLDTSSVESRGQTTREGEKKDTRLKVTLPKDSPALRTMLEQATADEFICLYTDGSGQQKVVGLLHAPLRFTYNHNTGARLADGNFYEGTFYCEGPDNTYFYSGTAGTPPTGPANVVWYHNDVAQAVITPGNELRTYSDFGFTEFFTQTP
jgi:hypothetical protein